MKIKPKQLVLAIGGLALITLLAFGMYTKLSEAKEQYCLAQTHARYPETVPMERAKRDFYSGCYHQISWTNAIGFLFTNPEAVVEDQSQQDMIAIRNFMNQPYLELTFLRTDRSTFFTIGTATEFDGGVKMEPAKEWERWVNVYEQTQPIHDTCSAYQYEVDPRRHSLVKVYIRNLSYAEVESLNKDGKTCGTSNQVPQIGKEEAGAVAKQYLSRALPDFEKTWDQFTYTEQVKNEHHSWLWEDRKYELSENLTGDLYSYPTISVSVFGNGWLASYQNTISLFEN